MTMAASAGWGMFRNRGVRKISVKKQRTAAARLAMLHLTRPSYLRGLFIRSRWAFANALVVIAGELTLGVLQGIALGVVLSLLTLIYLTSHPSGAELGQLPGTRPIGTCGATARPSRFRD
jgi:hypothetical protein